VDRVGAAIGPELLFPAVATFPVTSQVPVIRTDFTDDAVWVKLTMLIASPTVEGFEANVEFVEDRAFAGMDESAILRSLPGRYPGSFRHPVLFVVDGVTVRSADHPVLVVDLQEASEPSFRSIPREVQAIENNLSIANMDFFEFADAVGGDGVFRGF
jgi:hypothetical protein